MRRWIALLPLVALAACGETGTTAARPSRAAPAPPVPVPGRVPATATATVNLDGIRGQTARALIGTFGTPRIDLQEGPARKLQFAGTACVMDVYLYPAAQGREHVARHLDTRLRDGKPVDAASCLATLRK